MNEIKRSYQLYVYIRQEKKRTDALQYNCFHSSSGHEVINLFPCSTQLRMKFVLLINLKLLTIASSFLLNMAEHENVSANKDENANYCWTFSYLLAEKLSCSAHLSMKKVL